MTDCVCGMKPPERPNDDCERCQLIVENQQLKDKLEIVLHTFRPKDDVQREYENDVWLAAYQLLQGKDPE